MRIALLLAALLSTAWTAAILRAQDTGDDRFIRRPTVRQAGSTTALPQGFLAPDETLNVRRLLRGAVYMREGQATTCTRWDFRRRRGNLSMERRERVTWEGGGIWEIRHEISFLDEPPNYMSYAGESCRWIRRPRTNRSAPGCGGFGFDMLRFQVVRATPDRIDYITEHGVIGYRSDAVRSWYRTEAACNSATP